MVFLDERFLQDQRLLYFGVAGIAVSAWTLFVMWAMSAEKASSSGELLPYYLCLASFLTFLSFGSCALTVMKTITFNLRTSPLVQQALGEGIRPKPFLRGEPWVHGKVGHDTFELKRTELKMPGLCRSIRYRALWTSISE